ncbi:MAG: hypothetical protein JXR53_11355 [Bacteroidales bacterium]|nr:hypothetical protein [Bacteroidales bacterium]
MKKYRLFIVPIVIVLLVMVMNIKPYLQYSNLKEYEYEIPPFFEGAVFQYYRSYLSFPSDFEEFRDFCIENSEYFVEIFDPFIENIYAKTKMDSFYFVLNRKQSDTILDHRVRLDQTNYFEYSFLRKDIILYSCQKPEYCALEIMKPRYFKDGKYFADTNYLSHFYDSLSLAIQNQAPKNIAKRDLSWQRILYFEADILSNRLVVKSIACCDGDFSNINEMRFIVQKVLAKMPLIETSYTKAIIPFKVYPELISDMDSCKTN